MLKHPRLAQHGLIATLIVGTLASIALTGRGGALPAQAHTLAELSAAQPLDPSALAPSGAATPGAAPDAFGPAAAPTSTPADQTLATATPTRTPTPINIGNFVWDDFDKDGFQDAGEPGLAGVTVQLWNSTKTALIDQDVTNANGNYTVVAPLPGDYRIRVLLPSFLDTFTVKDVGADDQKDSDINPSGGDIGFSDSFTLASNVISTTTHDAGIIVYRPPTPTRTPTPINIGNFVWVDLNQNGIQDAGEPGLGGVTVQLWNADRTQLIDQDVTNANGTYTVVAPLPGDYRIRVLPPTGAGFAPKDAGADDQKDSDINRLTFLTTYGFSDSFTLASNVISTTIHDAGLINVPPTQTPSQAPLSSPTPTSTIAAAPESEVYLPQIVR